MRNRRVSSLLLLMMVLGHDWKSFSCGRSRKALDIGSSSEGKLLAEILLKSESQESPSTGISSSEAGGTARREETKSAWDTSLANPTPTRDVVITVAAHVKPRKSGPTSPTMATA